MGRHNMSYHAREGFQNIFSHGLMSFAAVSMIVACLLIMGSFSLIAVNMSQTLGDLEAESEFTAYVDETLTKGEIMAVEQQLNGLPNVAQVTFVDAQEALDSYVERYAEGDKSELFENLPADTLRHRFVLRVTDLDDMATTVNLVEGVNGVTRVQADLDITAGFTAVRNVATGVALILVAMLLVLSLFIIANTIKLATFYRREEIAIMKMCGATNWFIRWPFIFEGMILGLVGALLAFGLQWLIYELIIGMVVKYGGILDLFVFMPFAVLWKRLILIFAGAGLAIGAGGSLLSIRKFLQV